MISSDVGCWQSFEGRLDPAVLRLVGRVHMERPASEFLATGYAMPVADRDGVAFTGSREVTPQTKVLEYGHPQPSFSGGSAHVAPPSLDRAWFGSSEFLPPAPISREYSSPIVYSPPCAEGQSGCQRSCVGLGVRILAC